MTSQEEMGNNSPPAANTCLQREVRTITQDYLFHLMDTPGLPRLFTNQQAASRKYPLQFLCDFANAVFDDETSNLLEYQHLLKHPTYKEVWSKLFGKEIWHLATTTETIAFMENSRYPKQDARTSPTDGLSVSTARRRKIHTARVLRWAKT